MQIRVKVGRGNRAKLVQECLNLLVHRSEAHLGVDARTVLVGVKNIVVCIAQRKVVRDRRYLKPVRITFWLGAGERFEELSLVLRSAT